MAILVSKRHLVTCCHVLNTALGISEKLQRKPPPEGAVFTVRFPYLRQAEAEARLAFWGFGAPDGPDLAVLELGAAAPPEVGIAHFTVDDQTGSRWTCIGADRLGVVRGAAGAVGPILPGDILQLNSDTGRQPLIEEGYSGSAVWSEAGKAFIGMVATKDQLQAENGLSFALSAALIDRLQPDLLSHTPAPEETAQVSLGRVLPPQTLDLVGRATELDKLDAVWASDVRIAELVGEGGNGKTSIVWHWMQRMRDQRNVTQAFDWSFYNHFTHTEAGDSASFLEELARHFAECGHVFQKDHDRDPKALGIATARAFIALGGLVFVDGVEILQSPAGTNNSDLYDAGLWEFLRELQNARPAAARRLLVITTRRHIASLTLGYEEIPVGNLSENDAARFLTAFTMPWQDEALRLQIDTPADARAAAVEYGCNPLALTLLASNLIRTKDGKLRRRSEIRPLDAGATDRAARQAYRILDDYAEYFQGPGRINQSCRQLLNTISFLPTARKERLDRLRHAEPLPGLTDAIADDAEFAAARFELIRLRLISENDESLSAHPLVKEYFRGNLDPQAVTRASAILFEDLSRADSVTDLSEAILYGCQASRPAEAFRIYVDRIASDPSFSVGGTRVLSVIAPFFVKPWHEVIDALAEGEKLRLLNDAATTFQYFEGFADGQARLAHDSVRRILAGKAMITGRAEQSQKFRGLYDAWNRKLALGQLSDALADAQAMFAEAEASADPQFIGIALSSLAGTRFYLGHVREATAELEAASGLFRAADRTDLGTLLVHDRRIACNSYLGYALALLGRTDEAEKVLAEEINFARSVHPYSLCLALLLASMTRRIVGDLDRSAELAEEILRLANDYNMLIWKAAGQGNLAYARSEDAGSIDRFAEALEKWRSFVPELASTQWLTSLADLCLKHGQLECGLAAIARAEAIGQRTGERHFHAELFRVKAGLVRRTAGDAAARPILDAALRVAKKEGIVIFARRVAADRAALGPA
jgi:hypothetical protein